MSSIIIEKIHRKREKIVNLQRQLQNDDEHVDDSDDNALEACKDLTSKCSEDPVCITDTFYLIMQSQRFNDFVTLFFLEKKMDIQTRAYVV